MIILVVTFKMYRYIRTCFKHLHRQLCYMFIWNEAPRYILQNNAENSKQVFIQQQIRWWLACTECSWRRRSSYEQLTDNIRTTTSLYDDVGGVAKITDAIFCWYHGISANTKHLKTMTDSDNTGLKCVLMCNNNRVINHAHNTFYLQQWTVSNTPKLVRDTKVL